MDPILVVIQLLYLFHRLFFASITSSNNQQWVNSGWDWMKNKRESYFSDSYNLLTMLFITGNWWKPVPDDKNTKSNK